MADPGPVDFGANKCYFGGENAIENVDTFIEGYEVENLCRFIKVKSKRFVKPDRSKLNRRVFWESGYGLPPIQFDGVPFMVLGHQVRECFNGPDRHRARKKKKGPKKQGEHDYCAKSRRAIQTTKKMLCPAAIHLRSVVRFPALQIERNCDSARRRVGKQLSADLGDDEKEVAWEHRVYVSLPGVDAHQNHLVDDMGCMTHDVHKDVINKIHELVDDGVRNVSEMKRHITAFSRANVPSVPDTSNRFYPNNKCLRNHMYAALSLSQLSYEDQEYLHQQVGKWKVEKPNDQFYYVPRPRAENGEDVEDFIFVHQTAWQRRLLSKKYWQCEACREWLHPGCMGLDGYDEPDEYICSGCQLLQLPRTVLEHIFKEVVLADGDVAYGRISLVCSAFHQIASSQTFRRDCHLSWQLSIRPSSYWEQNRELSTTFSISTCVECGDSFKEEGPGFCGGHGRRGEFAAFYCEIEYPGFCCAFCARYAARSPARSP